MKLFRRLISLICVKDSDVRTLRNAMRPKSPKAQFGSASRLRFGQPLSRAVAKAFVMLGVSLVFDSWKSIKSLLLASPLHSNRKSWSVKFEQPRKKLVPIFLASNRKSTFLNPHKFDRTMSRGMWFVSTIKLVTLKCSVKAANSSRDFETFSSSYSAGFRFAKKSDKCFSM